MKNVLATLILVFGFAAQAKTSPVTVNCTLTKMVGDQAIIFTVKTNVTKDTLNQAIFSEGTEPYENPLQITATSINAAGVLLAAKGEDREMTLFVNGRAVEKGAYKATMELKIHTTDRTGFAITREVEAKDMTCSQI